MAKKGWPVELVGDQNPGLKAPPRSKRGGSKGDVRRGVTEKSRHTRVTEGEEARRDDPIEHLLPTGPEAPSEFQKG